MRIEMRCPSVLHAVMVRRISVIVAGATTCAILSSNPTRRIVMAFRSALALVALLLNPALCIAQQNYPDKLVRIVVAYPPGGGLDIVVRTMAPKLTERLGQPIVVDNRAGAAGVIGTDHVAKSAPDGYTLVMGTNSTHAIMASFSKNLPYDPVRDFTPVSLITQITNLVVVNPKVQVKSIPELLALARSKPDSLNYGSAGGGSTTHVAMELLKIMADVKLTHIPYKGLGPAVADLVAGQTQVMISNAPPVMPFVKSGRLTPLAVTGTKRLSSMPELPTVAEAGIPGYEADVWYGLLAPAGTPDAIVKKLHAAFVEVLALPDVSQTLAGMGATPVGNSPGEFAKVIRDDILKWAKVVKASGARTE